MTALSARYDLTGRTALVTGAGGLLGRQHVAALAEAGARVVVTDIGLAQVRGRDRRGQGRPRRRPIWLPSPSTSPRRSSVHAAADRARPAAALRSTFSSTTPRSTPR